MLVELPLKDINQKVENGEKLKKEKVENHNGKSS